MEGSVDTCFENWRAQIDREGLSPSHEAKKFDLAKSVRFLTLEIAARICFSDGLGFGGTGDEDDAFWSSIEEKAPFAQYMSVLPGLFDLVYALACIPGLKRRLILTETKNPGIGKILKVCTVFVAIVMPGKAHESALTTSTDKRCNGRLLESELKRAMLRGRSQSMICSDPGRLTA